MTESVVDQQPLFASPLFPRRDVIRWFFAVASVLLLAYLLLQNPFWVPGGDSDFYVSVARSMARGQGFKYNGLPVAISPPGWPWLMAQVLRFSTAFLTLKLLTMACMYASLLLSYFIALRFVKPSTAAIATLLCGLLMPVYSLTYFTHSEGLYCLLSAWGLLEALRVREGRGGVMTIVSLCALCVAIPLTRWAGIFQALPMAAVLLSGRRGSAWGTRYWKTAACVVLIVGGTFVVTRQLTKLSQADLDAYKNVGNGNDNEEIELPPENGSVQLVPTKGKTTLLEEYSQRFLNAGKWFAWLLWQPSRFASVSKYIDLLVGVIGWGVIGLLAWLAFHTLVRGEWLWTSLIVYCGVLCMSWPNPNSRYFVPVAPLILIGLLLVLQLCRERFPVKNFDLWKWLRRAFFYSVLLANLAMYGVDVIVMRSSHFYDTFEAGQHKDLINTARYLLALRAAGPTTAPAGVQVQPEDGDLVVNERYENLGRVRYSAAGSRSMTLLMDRIVKPLQHGKVSRYMDDFQPALGREMRRIGGDFLLIQKPAMPWRLWHFRLPMTVQRYFAKPGDSLRESGGWYLYHFNRDQRSFTVQPVPSVEDWPTNVPGME